jgi:hypothetical protein
MFIYMCAGTYLVELSFYTKQHLFVKMCHLTQQIYKPKLNIRGDTTDANQAPVHPYRHV